MINIGRAIDLEHVKDEIRKLRRIDKIEIYRWIDEQVAADLLPRIGVNRSLKFRQEIEQKCRVDPYCKRRHILFERYRLVVEGVGIVYDGVSESEASRRFRPCD